MTDTFERLKAALADRYRIEGELGSGGMATVYLAEDLKHERKVAVKVLRPDLAATLGSQRFLREIKIAAQLHHPHILPLHDSGEADGFLYYVMPYEEGQSLREKLTKEGELPVTEAVRLLRDVVDALAHAHNHGVVHRDIKPDNVMLSGRHALVTDFGVAKAVSEATGRQQLTTAGVALGTPAYMAPEQAVAAPHIDHRADIYAVGALAYELLTGRPPFIGTTPQMVLSAHVTEAPEPVTKYRETVPPALAQLVGRCLEKKPADRWQSAEELLPQLEALATPSGGMTPTDTRPVVGVPVAGRNLLVRGSALFGALVVVVIGWWLLAGRGGPAPRQPGGLISIAVLPCENRSASEEDVYFSDGIAQDINTHLQKVGGFLVKAHGSARWVDSAEARHREKAASLDVEYLVECSVRRADGRVHVNASLIDPVSSGQLWSEIYDEEDSVSDITAIERDVAQGIAVALNVAVRPEAQSAALATASTEAYNAYQLGRFQWSKRTAEALELAVEHFNRAIAHDSNYAQAYSGLADAYVVFPIYVASLSRDEALARAERAARRAIALDSTYAEPHAALGYKRKFLNDWTGAEQEFQRAIALDSSYAVAHYWYSELLRQVGQIDKAIEHGERAVALDPLSFPAHYTLGAALRYARRYDEAIAEQVRAIQITPTPRQPHSALVELFLETGRLQEAAAELEFLGVPPDRALRYVQVLAGQTSRQEAIAFIVEMESAGWETARAYARIGARDSAFAKLEEVVRAGGYPFLFQPWFDSLRTDARYEVLLRTLGLR